MNTTLTRKQDESDETFLERAAESAAAINGSVDTAHGTLCPNCAPFGTADGERTLGIVARQTCYNCTYGSWLDVR